MCGRFVSATPPDQIARYFDAVDDTADEEPAPNYNVAPTSDIFAIRSDGEVRRLERLHWGLVPFWAKDPSVGNRMINARAEGIAEKNAYKQAFRKKRCIIPADGFYEWKVVAGQKKKQPMYITRADGEPLAFAGLWEVWRSKENPDDQLRSCTIITGEPNDKIAEIHDRMPVILPPSAWATWLDPAVDDLDLLGQLLVPAPSSLLTVHPVGFDVNNVRNNDEHLVDPVDPATPADDAGTLPLGGAGS
ncbi:MAG: SOS response-associated peptidase [Acidimicrobiales bacterium]